MAITKVVETSLLNDPELRDYWFGGFDASQVQVRSLGLRVKHDVECPAYQWGQQSEQHHAACVGRDCIREEYSEITIFAGAVISRREQNGYHDSDFVALVWCEKQQGLREYVYASTRFGGGHSCKIDATPQVLEKARAAVHAAALQATRDACMERAAAVAPGKDVVVVKGRKFAKGTTGRCVRVTRGDWGPRAQVRTDAGDTIWISADNLAVADVESYLPSDEAMSQEAARHANSNHWSLAVA